MHFDQIYCINIDSQQNFEVSLTVHLNITLDDD
jgi:hypothetical protein